MQHHQVCALALIMRSTTHTGCSESSPIYAETLLDTYFAKLHAKPYYVLDEPSTRQRMQLNQLPEYLSHAIFAVAARSVVPRTRSLMAVEADLLI